MFKKDQFYTLKEINKWSNIHVQTLYKRLRSHPEWPVYLKDGVYKVKGDVAKLLTIPQPRGPKTNKIRTINDAPQTK